MDLVVRAQRGDLAAFNGLVLEHQHAAYSLALRFMGTREAAEDATQEAFIRAYQAVGRFQGDQFRSWLFTIVANTCRDELRKRRRRPLSEVTWERDGEECAAPEPADPGPTPEAVLLTTELRHALAQALLQLPEDWRLVVVLADVQGLPGAEVATVAGLPLGTVKSRLSRARRRLREILREGSDLPGGYRQPSAASCGPRQATSPRHRTAPSLM